MALSARRMLALTASTRRSPAIDVSGVRGAPVTYLTEVRCLPLDPLDAETRQRLVIETPHELRQTFVLDDVDILKGDILVIDTRSYPIKAVENWSSITLGATIFLVVEDDGHSS